MTTVKRNLERIADASRPIGAEALLDRVERQLRGEPTTGLAGLPPRRWPLWTYATVAIAAALIAVGAVVWLAGEDPATIAAPGPSGVDLWGLTDVDLPDTIDEVATVFRAMPDEIAGYPLVEGGDDEHLLGYGEKGGMSLSVQLPEHRIGADGEVMTPAEALTLMAGAPELDTYGSVLDGDVVWLHAATIPGDPADRVEYLLLVGEAQGQYLFSFDSFTAEGLDALVTAFVEATKAPPPTPTTTGPAPDTTAPETTTTTIETTTIPVEDPNANPWIGARFSAESPTDFIPPADLLPNALHVPMTLVVEGESDPLWPWHVGGRPEPFTGFSSNVVVVSTEGPNPYAPSESEQELEGAVPADPDPAARHDLMIWAVRGVGPNLYEVTDAIDVTLSGANLGYAAFEDHWCRIPVRPDLFPYAYVQRDADAEYEVGEYYPAATFAIAIEDDQIVVLDPELVECILNEGY